jgi:carbon storage regulator
MRFFTRRCGEMLRIGDDVILTVTSIRGGSVRLGFNVPRDVIVDREEVAEQKKRARVASNLDFAAQGRVSRAAGAQKPAAKKKPPAVKSAARSAVKRPRATKNP